MNTATLGSLVFEGCGIMQDKEKITCRIRILQGFEPFLLFTRGKRQMRCGAVFKVYAVVTGFKSCRFRRISVNEQPKW